jgi:tetratricopeptide (TPR) repeat protein
MAAELQILFDSLDLYNDATDLAKCALDPAPCLIEFAADKLKEAIMEAAGLKFDVREAIMTFALNRPRHFLSIAADPPDPDYQHLTMLSPLDYVDPLSNDPVMRAAADLGNAQMVEGALAEPYLAALERYQGADAVSDNEWGLIHAITIQTYAGLLAEQTARTNQAIAALDAALAADPRSFDDIASYLADFRLEIEQNGIPDETVLYLKNIGFTDEEIEEIFDEIIAKYPEGFTVDSFRSNLAGLIDANNSAITELLSVASDMQTSITYLDYYYIGERSPRAEAGGPYVTAEGAALVLDGSGSIDPDGTITAWDWDLDLDGAFDDATGVSPSVSFEHEFNGIVGLLVTDNTGRTSVDYALITCQHQRQAVISSSSPNMAVQEMMLGETKDFSVAASDPDGDALDITWTLDNAVIATGSGFSYQPTSLGEAGMHVVRVQVTDDNPNGGTAMLIWGVAVLAADADGDGWRANMDCNDGNAAINPYEWKYRERH